MEIVYLRDNDKDYYFQSENPLKFANDIVSICPNSFSLTAEYGTMKEGVYKLIEINNNTFADLQKMAFNEDRKGASGLLKKIHEQNKDALKKGTFHGRIQEGRIAFEDERELWNKRKKDYIHRFNNEPPILE